MTALRQIRVANDNVPGWLPTGPVELPTLTPLPEAVKPPAQKPPRTGRGIAAVYQLASFVLAVFALTRGFDPYALAGLTLLSALGGICVVAGWSPLRWLGQAGRELSGFLAAFAFVVASIVLAPSLLPQGLQDPMVLTALGFAAFGSVFGLRLCLIVALGGVAMILISQSVMTIPRPLAIQSGAIFALCCIGAKRTGSIWLGLWLAAAMTGGLFLVLMQSGLHLAQAFGTVALAATTLWTVGAHTTPVLKKLGFITLLVSALLAQMSLIDPASADALLQSTARFPLLAGLLIAFQGIVLGFNLLRWFARDISWVGVIIPQLALAAGAMLILDPTLLESATAVPAQTDIASIIGLGLGAVVMALSGVGLWRSWRDDRPVRTGLFAMTAMVQLGLLWPFLSQGPDLLAVGIALIAAAFCAAVLCRQVARDGDALLAI